MTRLPDVEGIIVGSLPYDYSDGRRGSRTDSEGKYWSVLPAGGHLLAVATDQPGFAVPTYRQFLRATREDAETWTHQRIEGEVGQTVAAERFTVHRVQPVQVIVSLPDGKPAVGATAVLEDETADSPAPGGGRLPGRFEDESDAVMTNSGGRASLIPRGALSTDGRVTVKLATTDEAYFATVKLSKTVDGVINVVLDRAQSVVGRVLVDGKGVPGARVSITQTQPYRRSVDGRTVMASLGTHVASVTTDGDGWYRAAVQPDSSYSVMVRSLPNSTMHPGIGFWPSLDGDGNLRVKDFAFFSGVAEIAGHVIDRAGQPVKGARVQIGRTSGVDPSFWMGHQSESQFETDEKGFFHLRRVPSGSYALRVYQPRSEERRPNMPIQLNVQTGTMDVEAILDTAPVSQPRRLEPKKIIPIQ